MGLMRELGITKVGCKNQPLATITWRIIAKDLQQLAVGLECCWDVQKNCNVKWLIEMVKNGLSEWLYMGLTLLTVAIIG